MQRPCYLLLTSGLLLYYSTFVSSGSLELLEPPEPALECSCEISGHMSFSAVHFMNSSGNWNTEITVSRGSCNSTDVKKVLLLPDEALAGRKPRPTLGAGYERFGSLGRYKMHLRSETWENARRTCEEEGAHLVVINSEAEAAVVKELFGRHPAIANTISKDRAFIGVHDQFNEGQYLTIFGEPLLAAGFDQWGPNPDNHGVAANHPGEDCITIVRTTGKMTDAKCDERHAFFCELEDGEYPPPDRIDYSAGEYRGVESEVKPVLSRVPRKKPGLGYELFPGVGYYKFHTFSMTWENARRKCQSEGGHLAIINNLLEEQVLLQLFKRHKGKLRNVQYQEFAYLGFHDMFVENHFVTIYGEQLTATGFYHWMPGSPNDLGGDLIKAGEDCGALNWLGGLNDVPCNMLAAFICEQELFL